MPKPYVVGAAPNLTARGSKADAFPPVREADSLEAAVAEAEDHARLANHHLLGFEGVELKVNTYSADDGGVFVEVLGPADRPDLPRRCVGLYRVSLRPPPAGATPEPADQPAGAKGKRTAADTEG